MSGGLREALEKLAEERDSISGHSDADYQIRPYELRDLLAAHPAEPAPGVNGDRLAKLLNHHYYDASWHKERQGFRCVCGWLGDDHVKHVRDVLLAPAAGVFREPQPVDREELYRLLGNLGVGAWKFTSGADLIKHREQVTDAVLALLNGSES